VLKYADEYLQDTRVDGSTYVVVLSHDPKLDDPALLHVLRTPARYIGAIGSRTTNEKRRARLREQGLSDDLIARIHAPIGLDIGAETPEEIALAIMAEMVAAKNGIDDRPLPEPAARAVTAG
jgi:xanthine dehydrogenase accessory factor